MREPDPSTQSPNEAVVRKEAMTWVVRLAGNRLSVEDRREFEAWRAQSPAHARVYESVSAVWNDPDLHAAATHAAFHVPPARIDRTLPRARRMMVSAGLATAAVLVLMTLYWDPLITLQADHHTGIGERRTITLPDQSTVILNTQTAVGISFEGGTRRVRLLKGEAFFQVTPDPDRPFLVQGARSVTQAVGTGFTVRSAERERVTVLEGTVEVAAHDDGEEPVRLHAGSEVEIEQGRLGAAHAVDMAAAEAWMKGRLVVNGMPLTQVLDEVRRYHPGKILLLNDDVGRHAVTGTYNLAEPTKIVALLIKTFPLRSVSLGDHLIILF